MIEFVFFKGCIKFLESYYLILVTKRRQIGCICGHAIYSIDESQLITIPHVSIQSDVAHSKTELRYFPLGVVFIYLAMILWVKLIYNWISVDLDNLKLWCIDKRILFLYLFILWGPLWSLLIIIPLMPCVKLVLSWLRHRVEFILI